VPCAFNRVTRLAEFSHIGSVFTLGSFKIFGLYFFHGNSYAQILTELSWATFWAIFSQTYLVTLHWSIVHIIETKQSNFSRPLLMDNFCCRCCCQKCPYLTYIPLLRIQLLDGDQCYDFKNIFGKRFGKNVAIFCPNYCLLVQKLDHNIAFW
jgi:hypothetical protein